MPVSEFMVHDDAAEEAQPDNVLYRHDRLKIHVPVLLIVRFERLYRLNLKVWSEMICDVLLNVSHAGHAAVKCTPEEGSFYW